jgi:hypothetical protein
MLSLLLWLLAPSATPPSIPNRLAARPDCVSIPRQVAGEDRKYPGTRLDQQPPGKLLYAVDRQVDGCRVATLVSEERRRQGR